MGSLGPDKRGYRRCDSKVEMADREKTPGETRASCVQDNRLHGFKHQSLKTG